MKGNAKPLETVHQLETGGFKLFGGFAETDLPSQIPSEDLSISRVPFGRIVRHGEISQGSQEPVVQSIQQHGLSTTTALNHGGPTPVHLLQDLPGLLSKVASSDGDLGHEEVPLVQLILYALRPCPRLGMGPKPHRSRPSAWSSLAFFTAIDSKSGRLALEMRTGSAIREAVSHGVAAAVVITLSVVFAVVGYAGLLAWAVLAGQPLGGALALPFMMLAALVASTLAILTGLFPATVLAHCICRRWLHWPLLAEIPVSTLLTAGAAVGVTVVVGLRFGVSATTSAGQGVVLAVILLVPLGVYWWVLQFSSWGIEKVFSVPGVVERPSLGFTGGRLGTVENFSEFHREDRGCRGSPDGR